MNWLAPLKKRATYPQFVGQIRLHYCADDLLPADIRLGDGVKGKRGFPSTATETAKAVKVRSTLPSAQGHVKSFLRGSQAPEQESESENENPDNQTVAARMRWYYSPKGVAWRARKKRRARAYFRKWEAANRARRRAYKTMKDREYRARRQANAGM